MCLNNILELKVQPFEKKIRTNKYVNIKDKVVRHSILSLLLFTTFHIKQCTTIQEERNTIRAFSWQVQNKRQKIFKQTTFLWIFFLRKISHIFCFLRDFTIRHIII